LIYQGSGSELGLSLRLREDSRTSDVDDGGAAALRYADVGTAGHTMITDGVGLEYGLVTRVGEESLAFTPRAAASIRIGNRATLRMGGEFKVDATSEPFASTPDMAYLGRSSSTDTRYRYSIAVSGEVAASGSVSASARRAAADALTFLVFDDRFDEFWDGLYLQKGDVLTDGVVSIRAEIGRSLQIAMMTSAGRVESSGPSPETKEYLAGEIRTHYEPTGTTLDVEYRFLEQPDLVDAKLLREIERLSIVVGQSLHLPVELRVLLGVSLTSEGEGLSSAHEESRDQARLIGGLSFSF
jgi:hypothetical protein